MYKVLFYIILCVSLGSCREKPKAKKHIEWSKEHSTELNKKIALEEELDIRIYLEMRKDWKMDKTGSGLQYYIYHQGEGKKPVPGDVVEIEYVISLLDGTECYRTKEDEYEELMVDKSEVETGVQEGLKKMKVGDKAKMIVPSHLGHGLLGDRDKIPPLTTLVIDIHLLGIKK
jgi:FKBP-type peptidyl-prolyl cis-trans isomerase FkpA